MLKVKLKPSTKNILHVFLQESYEGPEDLVEKMKSLSTCSECFLAGEHIITRRLCKVRKHVPVLFVMRRAFRQKPLQQNSAYFKTYAAC